MKLELKLKASPVSVLPVIRRKTFIHFHPVTAATEPQWKDSHNCTVEQTNTQFIRERRRIKLRGNKGKFVCYHGLLLEITAGAAVVVLLTGVLSGPHPPGRQADLHTTSARLGVRAGCTR